MCHENRATVCGAIHARFYAAGEVLLVLSVSHAIYRQWKEYLKISYHPKCKTKQITFNSKSCAVACCCLE